LSKIEYLSATATMSASSDSSTGIRYPHDHLLTTAMHADGLVDSCAPRTYAPQSIPMPKIASDLFDDSLSFQASGSTLSGGISQVSFN
jgi:hypothetical protein